MARGYDYFMVHVEAGRHLKLGRMTPAERCAWTHGVLAIAAKSKVRGAFMVTDAAATADDVALQANVPKKVAVAMLKKARESRLLEHDDALGAEWVHDFDEHNPEPKRDETSAERSRRYRDRQRSNRVTSRTVTRDARDGDGIDTPPEEEGEVEGKAEENAGERPSVIHPDLDEVMAIVSAPELKLSVERMAVNAACMSFRGQGADPIAAAHEVVRMTLEGHIRVPVASTLLKSAMGKQAEQAAKVKAAGEQPSRPAPFASSRRLSAADDLAQRERAAEEQLAREAAERGAA